MGKGRNSCDSLTGMGVIGLRKQERNKARVICYVKEREGD